MEGQRRAQTLSSVASSDVLAIPYLTADDRLVEPNILSLSSIGISAPTKLEMAALVLVIVIRDSVFSRMSPTKFWSGLAVPMTKIGKGSARFAPFFFLSPFKAKYQACENR